jgi:3-hydroxyacyl-[acyl-carrier-protein] dehydratase
MMEEEKPLADADADAPPTDVHPTMNMPLLPPPTQGQEVEAHGITISTESGSKSSEPTFTVDQAAPMEMDIEDDVRQPQPGQHPQFWSGE